MNIIFNQLDSCKNNYFLSINFLLCFNNKVCSKCLLERRLRRGVKINNDWLNNLSTAPDDDNVVLYFKNTDIIAGYFFSISFSVLGSIKYRATFDSISDSKECARDNRRVGNETKKSFSTSVSLVSIDSVSMVPPNVLHSSTIIA